MLLDSLVVLAVPFAIHCLGEDEEPTLDPTLAPTLDKLYTNKVRAIPVKYLNGKVYDFLKVY